MGISQDLYKKAKRLIPGGTQLLSKRPEMLLPDLWPAYYSKARGCEVWDLDGKKYIDASLMGVGSCILGYADRDVNKAVKSAVDNGSMCTLNVPEEVKLARLLTRLHPWARMVRFARSGGEAVTIAVRIARAYTGRDIVLFCGYHGWHDWYLSANLASNKALDGHLLPGLSPRGVPRNLKGMSHPFKHNDTESFLALTKKYKNKIGVIILESIRNDYPDKNFVRAVVETAKKLKAVLIVDEITAGFRLNIGGAHLLFNLKPDIAVFAKGMSNGFPMSAIIGRKEIMQVAQDTFISSTYWTERIGPAAAIAAIEKMKKNNVPQYLIKIGRKIKEGWRTLAAKHNIKIEIGGMDPLPHFSFRHKNPLVLKTLFTQLMLERGFLANTSFYASYAHKEKHIKMYLKAVDEVFCFISKTIKADNPGKYLKGPVCHSGFKRLT